MRFVFASLVLVAACVHAEYDHPADPPPDAHHAINCAAGFEFTAPKAGLTYSPNLIVIAEMAPFYADGLPGVVAIDEAHKGFEPTAPPTKTTLPSNAVEMRWPFSLEPGHRYQLYFSATECSSDVTFFTN